MKTTFTEFKHYFKEWFGKIDVYRVLKLFEVSEPAIQHAIKKLLCSGSRGAKGETQDWKEAIASIERAIEMAEEDEHLLRRKNPHQLSKQEL